jgi:hypothetical protein
LARQKKTRNVKTSKEENPKREKKKEKVLNTSIDKVYEVYTLRFWDSSFVVLFMGPLSNLSSNFFGGGIWLFCNRKFEENLEICLFRV